MDDAPATVVYARISRERSGTATGYDVPNELDGQQPAKEAPSGGGGVGRRIEHKTCSFVRR
jgi:hypothetical protein